MIVATISEILGTKPVYDVATDSYNFGGLTVTSVGELKFDDNVWPKDIQRLQEALAERGL